ncbi:metalloproteinase inhibitor 2-like [Entelurus aequoreus]|uniref:metalloproteinase inhibitor 2-like n=1 Tax=Entelurus aequoreus TaxID=161455 RepID=UPI002B1DF9BD|nr:metalloproteinase inhibitor 2-like [Entelurus aequoreus]
MMSWMKCCVFPLVLLCMWQLQEGAQACRCLPVHPQVAFCQSDVVIKAKVVAITTAGEFDDIKYDIELQKILRGPIKNYDTIYTAASSAACGVTLTIGVEYFITGPLMANGAPYVSSCYYVVPWKSSHNILVERYRMGCDCKINRCFALPCEISGPNECLWTDWLTGNSFDDVKNKQCACIKRSDGSCAWYKEVASPGRG